MYQFKGFTQKANKAINIALQEASNMGHTYVGTEHLLLGLIEEGTGVAYTVLTDNKITSDEYREKIETSTGIGSKTVLTPEDLTPRTKRVMQMAMVISSRMGNSYVGTEHLLLALLSESDSNAVKFLVELDVNIQTLAEELQKNMQKMSSHQDFNSADAKETSDSNNKTLEKYGRDLTDAAKKVKSPL